MLQCLIHTSIFNFIIELSLVFLAFSNCYSYMSLHKKQEQMIVDSQQRRSSHQSTKCTTNQQYFLFVGRILDGFVPLNVRCMYISQYNHIYLLTRNTYIQGKNATNTYTNMRYMLWCSTTAYSRVKNDQLVSCSGAIETFTKYPQTVFLIVVW